MILAALAHGVLLAVPAWWGGSPWAPAVIVALIAWQIVEAQAAPARPDTADPITRATAGALLSTVMVALLFPGTGHPAALGAIAAGVTLRLWAIHTLGPRFLDGVALRPMHEIETTGPYRFLHHPAAGGTLLAAAGVVGTLGSGFGAVVLVGALGPLTIRRMRAEDRMLSR